MKKTILLIACVAATLTASAAGRYGDSDLSEWFTFLGLIMIVWGILEIILFFKIWRMTNDVNELKKDHFNDSVSLSNAQMARYLRRNLVLGNLDNVKRTLLKKFIDNVEQGFKQLPSGDYEKDDKGNSQWINYEEKNLEKSIRPYVENLQKQYEKIGEPLPIYIQRMETYSDYFSLFVKDDLTVEVEKKP